MSSDKENSNIADIAGVRTSASGRLREVELILEPFHEQFAYTLGNAGFAVRGLASLLQEGSQGDQGASVGAGTRDAIAVSLELIGELIEDRAEELEQRALRVRTTIHAIQCRRSASGSRD